MGELPVCKQTWEPAPKSRGSPSNSKPDPQLGTLRREGGRSQSSISCAGVRTEGEEVEAATEGTITAPGRPHSPAHAQSAAPGPVPRSPSKPARLHVETWQGSTMQVTALPTRAWGQQAEVGLQGP